MLYRAKHIIGTFLLLLSVVNSFAQVKFTAGSSHSAVKTGDRFQVQFSANATMKNFKAPDLSKFRVLSGPNQSTQMSWVNGQSSQQITYSYILMAVKEGDFTIGAATATINNEEHKTEPFKISVGKGVKVQQNTSGGNNNSNNKQANVSDDLYIKATVSKSKVYQGEHLVATYKLFTRVNIADYEFVKAADLNGFWSQEIDLGQSQWKQEIIGGYRWHVATIRKIVLFPQRSGKLEIDPLEMKFVVQQRAQGGGQSVFDQFFGRVENVEYNLKSKPIKINVLPLPEPAPEGFDGSVGNLDMKVDVSANEVKANEAINIVVKVSGKGNLNLVENPVINFPSDFETYDPKVADKTKTTEAGVSGSKEFDFLVIPRHEGSFAIDPITFSYFNPSTKKYQTITSDPIQINVLKGDGSSDNMVYSAQNKEDIKILGNDIRYIHTNNIELVNAKESFYGTWKFYLLMLIAPILFVLAFIFRNKIRAAQRDVVGMKSKKAGKVASKLLSSAKQSLTTNNKNEFYENVSKALFGYISDKLNIPAAELNQNNIKDKLIAINVAEATTNELIETIELCDMARFAPIAVSEQEVYNKAEAIINKIEQELKA